MKECVASDEMIVIPLNENTPPFVPVSTEEHNKLKVKHTCKGGILNDGEAIIEAGIIIEFPKYVYCPSEDSEGYVPDGFVRIDKDSAKLTFCPICRESIEF